MLFKIKLFTFVLSFFLQLETSLAVEQTSESTKLTSETETISIYEEEDGGSYFAGETAISQKRLEKNKATDIHQVLKQVPGVYLQEEDGSGLRPNIGFRGAHPHRSKKINLMEDGILIAPAAYSSPAAYYFPLMENIVGVDVYKGPSSSKYGPNSIGGALNLKTRSFNEPMPWRLRISGGSYDEYLIDVSHVGKHNRWHWLVHSAYHTSTGFKELPNGADTGFTRGNAGIKLKYQLTEMQDIEFRFHYSGEDSDETYLGLTEDDFIENPYKRYSGSETDKINTNFRQLQLKYKNQFSDSFFISSTFYNHDYDRVWKRFEGFNDNNINISDILNNPTGSLNNYLRILRGQEDSLTDLENLVRANNDRTYLSRGWQTELIYNLPSSEKIKQNVLEFGYRIHYDSVTRRQTKEEFSMLNGSMSLVSPSPYLDINGQNQDSTLSNSIYVNHIISYDKWDLFTNLRNDWVRGENENYITSQSKKNTEELFTPGLELGYNFEYLRIFLGAHRGLSPVGPGQANNVKPEESINYQLGLKTKTSVSFESAVFLSEYSNIVSLCTFSSGCSPQNVDQKFNGGRAKIYGLEMALALKPYWKNLNFPIRLSSTYTNAEFTSQFVSESEEWGKGTINNGDPMPYIPELQTQLSLGVEKEKWFIESVIRHQSKSFDQSLLANRKEISAYGTVDLNTEYKYSAHKSLYIRGQNILNNEYVTSFRPIGARPGRPLTVIVGTQFSF